jgi:3-deoxy-7-phosphoheptulonate synthase
LCPSRGPSPVDFTCCHLWRKLAVGANSPPGCLSDGFKNGTNGDVCIALDSVAAASQPHHFMAVTKHGHAPIASTAGNQVCHIVLRGGRTPNDDAESVQAASAESRQRSLPARTMTDASHANSGKNPENQPRVIVSI